MPTVTSRTAEERDAALFIFSSHGVAQWGEESLFLFSVYLLPWVFSGMGRGDHLLLGISQQVLSLPLSQSAQCSIPLEKSVDNAGPSGRGGGETGSL